MQHDIPANVTGVLVSLDTVDPNGNAVHIGEVTTDMSGTFKMAWAPKVPGVYSITATFMGDDSYGSSWAETGVLAQSATTAPSQTSTAEIIQAPMEMYFIASTAAIIVAIAIVGLLLLRKRA
jgi:hypothetical protein